MSYDINLENIYVDKLTDIALIKIAPNGTEDKVRMFLSFSRDIENPNMPDP